MAQSEEQIRKSVLIESIKKRCGSRKGDDKKKCIESVKRDRKESTAKRKQSYADFDKRYGEQEKEKKKTLKKYGRTISKALKVIENKKRYGKEWSKRGKKK